MNVSEAVSQRMSTRAYLDKPVDKDTLISLFEKAQRSPSGGNVQPWRSIVLTGQSKQNMLDVAAGVLAKTPAGEATDRPIYPDNLWEPYRSRRFGVGEAMYAALGIPREDKMARLQWFSRNFRFFEAPVAVMIVIDERMGHGQWAHTGMFMQTLCLLAEEAGLGTCMQECWGILRPTLKDHLGLSDTEMLYCGIALGHPDKDHPVNQMRSDRAPLDEVVDFRD